MDLKKIHHRFNAAIVQHINSRTPSPSKSHMLITHIQGGRKRERERERERREREREREEESYRKSISSGKQITDRLGEKRECNDGCQKRGTMTVIMTLIF